MFDFLQKNGASMELAELIVELSRACAGISNAIVHTSTGKAGTQNVYGEDQLALDVQAENILENHLKSCPFVAAIGSEELDDLIHVRDDGKYTVVHDPLDGSSLVNVNMAVGTIVGIYEGSDLIGRTAREQVAALYVVYGPRTTLVLTVGDGVHEFLLLDDVWKYEGELSLGGDKAYFAPGNLRATKERDDYFALICEFMKEQYTLRYSGGMVPDINHILKKGSGVFLYPGMPSAPDGKLRLLFECGPMAMIMEQAGGSASNGEIDILDIKVKDLTQITPILIGSKKEVSRAASALS
ncbi:fructose-1,6-bisphosphatase [Candidatus Peregrinibacteria bacterium]|jgi:fructose-1,6-bisphosphatase I|nr:fructose-1,6-bisphosphatase [Candidatus Peregrinibacteria bacterium]MBT4632077.1 fructose-1,6-bisphosphatase [Candidatus Peregrinibacteria bacterium]MBT5517090.1 fructose-1,6-bisphosphatase [Candidatus Peregrinibacteria bacterium]MBT5823731.1 fructose-1,6-bisphosphatase [Candidatus Peregrinibacteria bacterium]